LLERAKSRQRRADSHCESSAGSLDKCGTLSSGRL